MQKKFFQPKMAMMKISASLSPRDGRPYYESWWEDYRGVLCGVTG